MRNSLLPFPRYSASNTGVTFKFGLEVVQRSSKMVPFESLGTVFYLHSTAMAASLPVSETLVGNRNFFILPYIGFPR